MDSLFHIYEKNLDTYRLWEKCASIRIAKVPLDFENLFTGKEEAFEVITSEAEKAIEFDGADVILLGSTTMHQAGAYMASRVAAPVINPGPVAIKLAETFVQLGLSHSKVGFPLPSAVQDEKFHSLMGAEREKGSSAGERSIGT